MAKVPRLSNGAATVGADAILSLLNSGYLRVYAGARPATADDSVAGNPLLAEMRFASVAFQPAVNGVATNYPIVDDSAANATGTASFFRAYRSDGTSVVLEGEVGTATADLVFNSTAFVIGSSIGVATLTYTEVKQ